MKKVWAHKANTFQEIEDFEENYYLAMPKTERVGTMQLLRELYYKIKPEAGNESRKGLRRVIKIIQ